MSFSARISGVCMLWAGCWEGAAAGGSGPGGAFPGRPTALAGVPVTTGCDDAAADELLLLPPPLPTLVRSALLIDDAAHA